MIALVRLVILRATSAGSMLNVPGSTSANTGTAFCARMTSRLEMTVSGAVITSSP
jgi:hypothetical protein